MLNTETYLFYGYSTVWILIALYIFYLARKIKNIEKKQKDKIENS